ncbi:MAG: YjgN family protein [Pseudomonadota bacterium]
MTTDQQTRHTVAFDGKTGEWFGIWIVNLLLTIVTLGIYSAWAKVRANKYFYGNTSIAGRHFDYHATGMQILIGRLIVVAALVVFSVLAALPLVNLILIIALIFALPWLLIRGARFAARNTSWSNVRFDFKAGYGDAFVTYILLPIGVALTLYTTIPFLSRRVNRFAIEGHSLGRSGFKIQAPIRPFYLAALVALGWVLAAAALGAILLAGPFLALISAGEAGVEPDADVVAPLVFGFYALLFLGFYPASILYGAMIRNVVYTHAELDGGHRFDSTVKPVTLLGIAVTNALAVVFSLGLALPWAQIRLTKYLADNTHVIPNGSLDAFEGQLHDDRNAIGDAYGDIEGIDLGGAAI